jgi:hypothetical protein
MQWVKFILVRDGRREYLVETKMRCHVKKLLETTGLEVNHGNTSVDT